MQTRVSRSIRPILYTATQITKVMLRAYGITTHPICKLQGRTIFCAVYNVIVLSNQCEKICLRESQELSIRLWKRSITVCKKSAGTGDQIDESSIEGIGLLHNCTNDFSGYVMLVHAPIVEGVMCYLPTKFVHNQFLNGGMEIGNYLLMQIR